MHLCPECEQECDCDGLDQFLDDYTPCFCECDEYAQIECLYCNSPAHPGRLTCGRAACVEREIVAQVERG
jgi:hypothetical protein